MTGPDAEYVAAAIRAFDEGLSRAGFRNRRCGDRAADWEWSGHVGPTREPATVTLTDHFPFAVPRVVLTERAGRSDWHQTSDGALCLWDSHSLGDMPWLNGQGLVDRVGEWIANAEAGWVGDAPQLDLEAYHRLRVLKRGGDFVAPLLLIEDWSQIVGHWFTATQPDERGVITLRTARLPRPPTPTPMSPRTARKRARKNRRAPRSVINGLAVDLGEMTTAIVTAEELLDSLGSDTALVHQLIGAGRDVLIAARYTRSGSPGLLGFWLQAAAGGISRETIRIAERSASQRRRAGWHAESIEGKSVSVIGAGSIGSFLADLLDRSGVRNLRLYDGDQLMPGNLVRHAASPAFVGAVKTVAVRDTAALRDPGSRIQTADAVGGLPAAVDLLRTRDLVIDCSGDRLTWQLLQQAAALTGDSFLHVAVTGHGQFGRVDVCPPVGGAAPLPPDPVNEPVAGEREAGCGDPVSPTPPAAVAETAAMGARLAIRMLAGEPIPPAGESRELFPVAP